MRHIAVYGGSFDPPHKGHRVLAENLAAECKADKVIIMPAFVSPFKSSTGATGADRLEMCRRNFDTPLFEVSDFEISQGGVSYTVNTLRELKKIYPGDRLFLFMGDDMFLSLNRWYEYREILSLCTPVASCRTEDLRELEAMNTFAKDVLLLKDGEYIISKSRPVEISSTDIRRSIKNGEASIYLQENVADYIKEKGLYGVYPNEKYIELLKSRLTEKRFIHSLNVADSAKSLAKRYGADEEKAYTVGLVHDICKDMPAGLQLSYMLENGVELTELEISAPKLYHAVCGSVYAEKELGWKDEDMLNAIRYHTTGRAGMSLLEKVVFIADFISAERDYNGVESMRERSEESLEAAITEGLAFTVCDLIENGKAVHPDTIDAYNDSILAKKEN